MAETKEKKLTEKQEILKSNQNKSTRGGKRKGAGQKKGNKWEKTKAWDNLGEFITESGAGRIKTLLETSDEKTFFQYYTILLEYFKPKQSRVENTGDQEITIKFKREIDGKKS